MVVPFHFEDEAKRFLARTLHRCSFADRQFVLQSADCLTRSQKGVQYWILVPCYFEETFSSAYLLGIGQALRKHAHLGAVFFINGYGNDQTKKRFQAETILREKELTEQIFRSDRLFIISRFFRDKPAIGRVRGLLGMSAVISCIRMETQFPFFIFHDADTVEIGPDYFETLLKLPKDITKYASGPVRYLLSTPDRQQLRDSAVPELYLFDVANSSILELCRTGQINFERRVWPDGANLVVSGAAYCAVDGFDFSRVAGEDDAIGRALHRYSPNLMGTAMASADIIFESDPVLKSFFVESAWVKTDPRRVLEAIVRGHVGVEAWTVVPFVKYPGTSLDLVDTVKRYLASGRLIQETDLPSLAEPVGVGHRDRIVGRIVDVILESGRKDFRIRNSEQMGRYAEKTGLCSKGIFERFGENDLDKRIDISNSPLLNQLGNLVSK